jgi:putative salt-induced outer membrane protein YdiY
MFAVASAFVVVSIPALSAYAQSSAAEEPRWRGDVAAGLSLARGNAATTNFSFSFSASGPVGKNLAWENKGVYLFGSTDGRTSAESGLIASRLAWQHTSRLLSYYEIQARRDRFKNYSSRILPTVGIGFKVIDRKEVGVVLDAGLGGVFTKLYDSAEKTSFAALKGGESLVWKISETAEINEKLELVAPFSEPQRYLLRWEANVVTALAESWAIKLTVIDSYDNRPLGEGVKGNDIALIAALTRKF